MKDALREVCEEFIKNRDVLKENFRRDGMMMHLMGAAVMCASDNAPDAESLLECRSLLKKLEGLFSPFRGALKLPVIIYMAGSDDSEEYLRKVRSAYDLICTVMGSRNEKYYAAAMDIAARASSEEEMKNLIDDDIIFLKEGADFDGLISQLNISEEEAAAEIKSAEEYLGMQKGFGLIGRGSEMRNMYAKMLVCMAYGSRERAAGIAVALTLDAALESRFRA